MKVNAPIKTGGLRANMDNDQFLNEYQSYYPTPPKRRCEVCRHRAKEIPIKDGKVRCEWEGTLVDYLGDCGYFKNWTIKEGKVVMDPEEPEKPEKKTT